MVAKGAGTRPGAKEFEWSRESLYQKKREIDTCASESVRVSHRGAEQSYAVPRRATVALWPAISTKASLSVSVEEKDCGDYGKGSRMVGKEKKERNQGRG